MAIVMFSEKIIATKPKIEGASVSISLRRGQVSFSVDAVKLMGLKVDKTFLGIGFDEETNQLSFFPSEEEAESKAKVTNLHVKATDANVSVIYIWSVLNCIKDLVGENAKRYPLYENKDHFYIKLSEGVEKSSKKSVARKKGADVSAPKDQQKPQLEAVKSEGKLTKKS